MEIYEEISSIIFIAIALSMDAFSIALGIGMQKLRLKRIAWIGMIFGFSHLLFPSFGMIIGKIMSIKIGQYTVFIGGIILFTLGVFMLFNSFSEENMHKISEPYGMGLLIMAVSVSIDSLPVGISLGLSGAQMALTLIIFGIFATGLTWLALLIGRKVQGILGIYSYMFGGSILMAFGLKMIFMP